MVDPATPDARPTTSPAPAPGTPAARGGVLRGTTVAPGLVLGIAHRKDYDLAQARAERVPLDRLELELNRFRRALDDSRRQLRDLKAKLEHRVATDDARILDTHLLYLKDSAFIADVEHLILNEQLGLEAAIAKVIGDFDRIFRLVESETLRQSAVDLRDVGIRVLRNLESTLAERERPGVARQYVLVSRELSIVDMFNLANECVLGIATEAGGLSSHAAIFARSMRIPTLTGIEGLLELVKEGDELILDASDGTLRVNPDEAVRAQYRQALVEVEPRVESSGVPAWAQLPLRTRDGVEVTASAACGNLPEVEQAVELGMPAIGLYRTELSYLVDRDPPSRDALVQHYRGVIEAARGRAVTFRLLNADSGLQIGYLHGAREPNPALGMTGIRLLLAREDVLRRQIQAILLAALEAPVRIAIPFAVDCADLRRVKEVLFDERLELRKQSERFQDRVLLGPVIETPASLLGLRDLARESEFLVLNLDSFLQHLLAADRDNPGTADLVSALHPFALRALNDVAAAAAELERPLTVFGVAAAAPHNVALLVGAGLREFALPPGALEPWVDELGKLDSRAAARAAQTAARSSCADELSGSLAGYRHGLRG